MASDLTLAARLQLDAHRWVQGLAGAQARTRGFVASVRREFSDLRSFAQSTSGTLASIGVGYAASAVIAKSAHLDRDLEQVRQIAKATTVQTEALRQSVFELGKTYGVATDQAHEGFRQLVAGGLSWEQANTALGAMSQAVAVTKANYTDLGNAMKAAAANFGVNLGDLKETTKLINEMAAAADAGSAEIENLASIFGALGSAPSAAGMSRQRAMAYVEAMAGSVDIGQLGTRVKSTMTLFNNQSYMQEATRATGVQFYRDGVKRDDIEVLKDLRAVILSQSTQQARDRMLFRAFGKADMDMQQGARFFTAMPGNVERLSALDARINGASASGIADRVPAAINNAVDSANRLKSTLGQAADGFARPINSAITRLTKYALDSKERGGLNLSGGDIAIAGAVTLAAAYAGGRMGKGILGRLSGGAASLGTGVAMGTALEKVGAAMPVFVVGAAPGVFSGVTGAAADAAAAAAGAGKAGKSGKAGGRWGTAGAVGLVTSLAALNMDQETTGADAFLKENEGRRGFDWARRGGLPGINFAQDMGKSVMQSIEMIAKKMQLDLNVKVEGGTATVTSARGPMFTNVRSGSSSTSASRGRMMPTTRAGHE